MNLPVDLPVELPELDVPDIELPVDLPAVHSPGVSIPHLQLPAARLP